jgi:dipeptidyl aminopeptidase/acylaminoacyl peptidase
MLLIARAQPGLGTYDIWRQHILSGNQEQLTFKRGSEITPVWIDGERGIVYASDSPGSLPHLFRMDLATRTEKELLAAGPHHQLVGDVFPNGRAVAYAERELGEFKLFQLPVTRGAPPTPLLPGRRGSSMRFSPDGRAMAYVDAGRAEMNVALVEGTGEPAWESRIFLVPWHGVPIAVRSTS